MQEQNSSVKPYLPIIQDAPRYPIIYDANGVVLSLPPIINSEHSKMVRSEEPTDIFIEVTATDFTKANIVLNTLCAMFSRYCATPFSYVSSPLKNGEFSSSATLLFQSFGRPD